MNPTCYTVQASTDANYDISTTKSASPMKRKSEEVTVLSDDDNPEKRAKLISSDVNDNQHIASNEKSQCEWFKMYLPSFQRQHLDSILKKRLKAIGLHDDDDILAQMCLIHNECFKFRKLFIHDDGCAGELVQTKPK
jgi:hypothetical protein